MKQPRAEDVSQEFTEVCECGKRFRVTLRHWEVSRCSCNRFHWALRPKKNGPMVLFPWPGDYYTKANHDKFLDHLERSREAVELVAGILRGKGVAVEITPMTKAKKRDEWREHADNGDLSTPEGIVEVKRLGVQFTCRANWPFGSDFIVCAVHSFKRERRPTYWILSNDMKFAAIVRHTSFDKWTVEKRSDSRYTKVSQSFYFAPLDCVEWITL